MHTATPQLIRHQYKTGYGALFTPAQVECQHHTPAPPSLLLAQATSKAPQLPAGRFPQAVVSGGLCLPAQAATCSA